MENKGYDALKRKIIWEHREKNRIFFKVAFWFGFGVAFSLMAGWGCFEAYKVMMPAHTRIPVFAGMLLVAAGMLFLPEAAVKFMVKEYKEAN